jgi:hypothetical protein
LTGHWRWDDHCPVNSCDVLTMRRWFPIFLLLLANPAWSYDDLVLPTVDFSATDVQESGSFLRKETIHYTPGKLRIDRGDGFASTILDLTTQTECVLMVNHTYLVLPMDDELYRRFIAHTADMSGARKIGADQFEGLTTTKYAFGNDGALRAAGYYWLTDTGIMVRRDYEDGVFGQNIRHREYLTNIKLETQSAALFTIPAGYTRAN